MLGSAEDAVVDAFRHGRGVPYSAYPRFHAVMAEESRQTVVEGLLNHILPLSYGLIGQLGAGIDVLDIACGSGGAVLAMAETFPLSRFTGVDMSAEAIAAGRAEVGGARRPQRHARPGRCRRALARGHLPPDHGVRRDSRSGAPGARARARLRGAASGRRVPDAGHRRPHASWPTTRRIRSGRSPTRSRACTACRCRWPPADRAWARCGVARKRSRCSPPPGSRTCASPSCRTTRSTTTTSP